MLSLPVDRGYFGDVVKKNPPKSSLGKNSYKGFKLTLIWLLGRYTIRLKSASHILNSFDSGWLATIRLHN